MGQISVNGTVHELPDSGGENLLTSLRDRWHLAGTKRGCDQGVCGACLVVVDGLPVRACLTLTAASGGCEVTTIEGMKSAEADVVRQALVDAGAVQCGFCTPGIVVAATLLLASVRTPSAEQVRAYLAGQVCRCTGYRKIVEGVLDAARIIERSREGAA